MRFKFLSLFAAALLLGACESTPEEDTMTNTGGSTSSGTSTIQTESVAPGSQEDLTVNVGDRVFFAYDSSEISAEAQGTLQQLSAWLNKYPQVVLQVQGHCDERGTREYNLALGARRAASVRNYLVAQGVAANRLDPISYGKEVPAQVGSNESAWAQNRRGQFVVQ